MIDWLIGTLLATSALIVLVLLVREPVRRHFGARVAYGLWLIPAARLFMPTLTYSVERPVSATVPARLMNSPLAAEPLLLSSVSTGEPSLLEQAGGWPMLVLVAWLGVASGLFAARLLAFRRERAAILDGAVELGRVGSIRLIQSAEVSGPIAFGILDRVIAVPADFMGRYDEHERRLALEHELAHHRSGDLAVNLAAFALLCLQWFNPLAWMAHAAFRFDQEAACDARVLEKSRGQDRSEYGRAIAKAASGRALLFASALDRRNTLHRRLKSMLSNPSTGRRMAGRLAILAGMAAALPLTATRAIDYVDVPTAPSEPVVPKAPLAPAMAAAVVAPVTPVAPVPPVPPSVAKIENGTVIMNGHAKEWSELTPVERAEVRRSIAEAREELGRINHQEMQREIRHAMEEARVSQEEMQRELADARVEIEQAAREIDAHAAELRRIGQDPDQLKATVRASLESVHAIDVGAITRQALASVDSKQIAASLAAAQDGLRRAEAELDRAEAAEPRR